MQWISLSSACSVPAHDVVLQPAEVCLDAAACDLQQRVPQQERVAVHPAPQHGRQQQQQQHLLYRHRPSSAVQQVILASYVYSRSAVVVEYNHHKF